MTTLPKKPLYLNGTYMEPQGYKTLYAPHTGEAIAEIARGSRDDMKKAID